jgi:hypothetical protein
VSEPAIIPIMCPSLKCRRVLAVPEDCRGKVVRCRWCAALVLVPRAAEAPAAPGAGNAGR